MPPARVSLYEDPRGELILHRAGSPYVYVVADAGAGRFADHAGELAADRWSEMTGQLIAWWEDGWVTGYVQSGDLVLEASDRAQRYVGAPGPRAR